MIPATAPCRLLDDIVSTTGHTFLGLTISCARCHDHKIGPLPQRGYYAMLAFFNNVTPMSNGGDQIERLLSDSPDGSRRSSWLTGRHAVPRGA